MIDALSEQITRLKVTLTGETRALARDQIAIVTGTDGPEILLRDGPETAGWTYGHAYHAGGEEGWVAYLTDLVVDLDAEDAATALQQAHQRLPGLREHAVVINTGLAGFKEACEVLEAMIAQLRSAWEDSLPTFDRNAQPLLSFGDQKVPMALDASREAFLEALEGLEEGREASLVVDELTIAGWARYPGGAIGLVELASGWLPAISVTDQDLTTYWAHLRTLAVPGAIFEVTPPTEPEYADKVCVWFRYGEDDGALVVAGLSRNRQFDLEVPMRADRRALAHVAAELPSLDSIVRFILEATKA